MVTQVNQERATSRLPILLLGSLSTIRTESRLQKLAFLVDREILKDDYEMYSDWIGAYYGPYGPNLTKDLKQYSLQGLIEIEIDKTDLAHKVWYYSLTSEGKEKFDSMFVEFGDYILEIKKSLSHYQLHDINTYLMQYVYKRYPEYAENDYLKQKMGRQ